MRTTNLLKLSLVFIAAMAVLIGRLVQLQLLEHDDWSREALRSRSHVRGLPYERGKILDRHGQVLAKDRRAADLIFEYREFRRFHPAGQLYEAASLLGGAPGGLEWCWDNAEQLATQMLDLKPLDLAALSASAKADFLFYMRHLAGMDSGDESKAIQVWAEESNLSLNQAFPNAQKTALQNIDLAFSDWLLLENYLPGLMGELEQERRKLEWWVRQRALRSAAGRGFGLTAWQVYKELSEDSEISADFIEKLMQRWHDESFSVGAVDLLRMMTAGPARIIVQRQKQFDNMGVVLRFVEKSHPQDLSGVRRQITRDVHGNRLAYLRRDIDYELVDLLARNVEKYPGLYPQEDNKRSYPDDKSIHMIGRLRAPSAVEAQYYYELRDDLKRLTTLLERSDAEEASLHALKKELRTSALRPDEAVGASGYEWAFRDQLRGERGFLESLDTATDGPWELAFHPASDGQDLRLAVDSRLTESAIDAINQGARIARHRLRENGASKQQLDYLWPLRAGFALIDLRDGSIPVVATTPTYSAQQFRSEYASLAADRDAAPLRHRALGGGASGAQTPYPGSTFKLVAAVEALSQDPAWWERKLLCQGVFRPNGPTGIALHCEGHHGEISMRRAIRHSCNVFFYRLGRILGYQALHRRAQQLGFGVPVAGALTAQKIVDEDDEAIFSSATGLPEWNLLGPNRLLERGANWLRDVEKARGNVAAMHMAIGQAHVTSSPLQMARFYGWLGCGKLWEPRMVLEVGGQVQPATFTRLSLPATARKLLQQALLDVVENPAGTAYDEEYPLKKWEVAGKTGTAQVGRDKNAQAIPKHAWFAGYFPASNPRYAVAIMCENSDLHGGEISTLILHAFLELEGENLLR